MNKLIQVHYQVYSVPVIEGTGVGLGDLGQVTGLNAGINLVFQIIIGTLVKGFDSDAVFIGGIEFIHNGKNCLIAGVTLAVNVPELHCGSAEVHHRLFFDFCLFFDFSFFFHGASISSSGSSTTGAAGAQAVRTIEKMIRAAKRIVNTFLGILFSS